jgi:uncharacterized protein YdeI (YjbR/CyaY-like superfamily)
MPDQLFFENRDKWRSWLKENHKEENDAWLLFYKKRLNKGVSYEEAVEEALCFGWIDGKMRRIDEKKHTIRFSPRKKKSIWSNSNKLRVRKLIKEGKMTEAGLRVLPASLDPSPPGLTMPSYLQQTLSSNPEAGKFFSSLTVNQRDMYVYWIISAKKEETREKRLQQLLKRLKEKKKPGEM